VRNIQQTYCHGVVSAPDSLSKTHLKMDSPKSIFLYGRCCRKIKLQVLAGNEQVVGFDEVIGYASEPRISMGKLIIA
jgi:hypothetical protein